MGGVKAHMGVTLAACLALLFQVCSAATSHTVGDSTGWTIPPSPSFYSTWASKQTFVVGDFIVFNFQSGAHTVAEVTKKDYDACATTSPISQLNNGPANLTISSAGTHYYICTIVGHCSGGGQKVAITASAAASTSPPTSSPAPKSAAPAPKSTAAPTPKSSPSPTTAPSPKSTTTPTASPTPKSSPAAPTPSAATAPTPSSGAPTPTASAPSPMTAPAPGPSAAGSPESAAPGPASMSPANAPTSSSGASPPAPPAPTGAPASTPGSHSAATGAGLVLPLLAIIGANLFY